MIQTTTNYLQNINTPDDIKMLEEVNLQDLAHEVRHEVVSSVSQTGGHLGASLGVVELTVALHYVFNTPQDRLIWDVGHQAYPHKILTGRKEEMKSLRQKNGLSGFTKRSESLYDPFGAAHSSTSISAGLGMAVAKELSHDNKHIISVIGDGSMSAGMAFEAMNNAGAQKAKMIVILNDNEMSIDPPAGALSRYLSKLASSNTYRDIREFAKKIAHKFPKPLEDMAKRFEEHIRTGSSNGTIFEHLGFYYIGPIDGHNIEDLLLVLKNVRDCHTDKPVLIHTLTNKGHGYIPAETAQDKYHGVSKFDIQTGKKQKPLSNNKTYTQVFSDQLCKLAYQDKKITAITAAMPSGTGLQKFIEAFPERSFDVGIAEQHAVTFAAGMATEGYKPFVAIYSTFLQRAYDQIVHDVALQNLPVRFAIDRAGLVGADGATHAGSFDIAYLGCLPNFILMACSDEVELARMVLTAYKIESNPCAFRYPRGEGKGVIIPDNLDPFDIGKGRLVRQGHDMAILSYGGRLTEVLKAAERLQQDHNISITVADARFAKPLDQQLINQLVKYHPALITIEEGSIGGFGSFVSHYMSQNGHFDNGYKYRSMYFPDKFIDQASPYEQYDEALLNEKHIVRNCLKILQKDNALQNQTKFSAR